MSVCESCGRNVARRTMYVSGEIRKRVCQECKEKMYEEDYILLCKVILNKGGSRCAEKQLTQE